jgi:hypothetical protein
MPELREVADLIARHLPPSLDRVRVRPLDAPAREWADALATEHFATVVDHGECDAALASDPALISPAKLRPGGRVICLLPDAARGLPELARTMTQAGFTRILVEEVLDGAFTLARGEPATRTMDHDIGVVTPGTELARVPAGARLPRYLHLLVHQEPPSRGWEAVDPASIIWQAMTVREVATAEIVLVGFSSLVKAVAFMKAAVRAGAIPDINKLPRYRGDAVAEWGLPVLLDPAFEALRDDARFRFDAPSLRIDPRAEEKLRE